MAAFSYQHHHHTTTSTSTSPTPNPLLDDSPVFLPNYNSIDDNKTSTLMGEESGDHLNNFSSCFPYYANVDDHDLSCLGNESRPSSNCVSSDHQQRQIINKQADSSSMVIDLECSSDKGNSVPIEKKMRSRDGSCSTSAQSKDSNNTLEEKKLKKRGRGVKDMEQKIGKAERKSKRKSTNEQPPPSGYVHVRARRGEATDSHSLAERVRREKISKRLKMLQGLVPGCDKVASKALMLDEIINYVQSLQHQVEFLSMKLASLTPLFCDFGPSFNDLIIKPEKISCLESPLSSLQQSIPAPSTIYTDNSSLPDGSISLLLQQGQMPSPFSQDNGMVSWGLEDQRQRLVNQCGFTNLCSLQ
ncbi:hypothetical protein Sjap_016606 [Stephania japonica]|uniref:BHLH domain-containing protein n=1 Tax=Stephania japonica TaxID=461633 RepID=A0AAP0ILB0_9MAGN